jgi:hypothetical protein
MFNAPLFTHLSRKTPGLRRFSESTMGTVRNAIQSHITPMRAAAIFGGVSGMYVVSESILRTDAGITNVMQNTLTGELNVYDTPGISFRVPFFSKVTSYKQVMTASFGEEDNLALFCSNHPIPVRFADTYTGSVPCTFRFRLSTDKDQIRQMHKDFRSQSKLANTLLARNCKNVVIITATQYTGEEFFQGGLVRMFLFFSQNTIYTAVLSTLCSVYC